MEKVKPSIGKRIKGLWEKFRNKEYRTQFVAAHIGDALAMQIYAMRNARNWTQADLAAHSGMKQPRISALEESCYGASLSTLKKLAEAFDVALSVKFIPYSRLAEETVAHSIDNNVVSFDNDHPKCIADYDAVLSGEHFLPIPVPGKEVFSREVRILLQSPTGAEVTFANLKPNYSQYTVFNGPSSDDAFLITDRPVYPFSGNRKFENAAKSH